MNRDVPSTSMPAPEHAQNFPFPNALTFGPKSPAVTEVRGRVFEESLLYLGSKSQTKASGVPQRARRHRPGIPYLCIALSLRCLPMMGPGNIIHVPLSAVIRGFLVLSV